MTSLFYVSFCINCFILSNDVDPKIKMKTVYALCMHVCVYTRMYLYLCTFYNLLFIFCHYGTRFVSFYAFLQMLLIMTSLFYIQFIDVYVLDQCLPGNKNFS